MIAMFYTNTVFVCFSCCAFCFLYGGISKPRPRAARAGSLHRPFRFAAALKLWRAKERRLNDCLYNSCTGAAAQLLAVETR